MKNIRLPEKFKSSNKEIPKGSTVIDIKNRMSVMIDKDGNHISIDPVTKKKVIIKRNSDAA